MAISNKLIIKILIMITSLIIISGCYFHPNYMGGVGDGTAMTFRAIGKGLAPEYIVDKEKAVYMAERAAIADGYRRLAERIYGVYVTEQTKLSNGSVDYDAIHLEVSTWVRGADITEVILKGNNTAEAHMQLKMNLYPGHILYHFALNNNQLP